MQIKIGADPELFVMDSRTGKFVCAHGLVQGTKDHPQPVEHGAVQVDGMALEFNIDPAETEDQFMLHIQHVREQMQAMIDPAYVLTPVATAYFDVDYFAQCPEEAKMLGCTPDYNAWTEKMNERPETNEPFRTGAGHIHCGWTQDMDIADPAFVQEAFMVVKQLDVCVGQYSPLWDDDVKRRTLYGAAGACRIKSYGVEYRPLSNAWLRTPELTSWVYRQTYTAIQLLAKGHRFFEKHGATAQRIINSSSPVEKYKLTNYLSKMPITAINGLPPMMMMEAA